MTSHLRAFLVGAAIAGLAAPAAQAGGVAPVAVEAAPVAVAPPPINWSGIYGGLGYGRATGGLDDGGGGSLETMLPRAVVIGGASNDFEDGTAAALFAGYNWQSGNFVLGGELAYVNLTGMVSDAGMQAIAPGGFENRLKNAIDLKARLGFAAGRALPYLAVGYSLARFDEPGGSHDLNGVSYGLGLDYLVSDHVFVGVEYLKRDLSGDGFDLDASTLGLRIGYKF